MVSWVVLKFGGTSVAGRQQWNTIAELIANRRQDSFRVLVVCSAISGITNMLEGLQPNDTDGLTAVLDRHLNLASELDIDATDLVTQARRSITDSFRRLEADSHPRWRAQIMAQGEWLSTRMGRRFLSKSLPVDWVDASEALAAQTEPDAEHRRAWLSARCLARSSPALEQQWRELNPVLITQGFVARHATGGTALLGRGGSDTSAALLGARLQAHHVEIWTDVPGLFTADPRTQADARLIERLTHAEALEMAAGGARVIHSRSIRAAAEGGMTLWIRDLADVHAPGTRIDTGAQVRAEGIRAVIRQTDMLVLLLENLDTRQQVGFLASVFSAISQLGVSVDLVATSETTTTLAINKVTNLLDEAAINELRGSLESLCRVQVFEHCSCVNLVGYGARTAFGQLADVQPFFHENRLLMASLSANDLCLSLLVEAEVAPGLAELLHTVLIRRVPPGRLLEVKA